MYSQNKKLLRIQRLSRDIFISIGFRELRGGGFIKDAKSHGPIASETLNKGKILINIESPIGIGHAV